MSFNDVVFFHCLSSGILMSCLNFLSPLSLKRTSILNSSQSSSLFHIRVSSTRCAPRSLTRSGGCPKSCARRTSASSSEPPPRALARSAGHKGWELMGRKLPSWMPSRGPNRRKRMLKQQKLKRKQRRKAGSGGRTAASSNPRRGISVFPL